MKRNDFKEIKTNAWHTIMYVGLPASKVNFNYVDRDLEEPETAKYVRKNTWGQRLLNVKGKLELANPNNKYLIKEDHNTGKDALFQIKPDEKKKMWDGTTITLAQDPGKFIKDHLTLNVYPIDYSEWVACMHPQYAQAFRNEGFNIPYAGIGISVLIKTNDGFAPLTVRGIETPVYPGRLYSPGGGPKEGQTSAEALIEEIVEETGLEPKKHFDPSKLFVTAFVSDTHFHDLDFEPGNHSRPELVAELDVDVSFADIENIQYKMMRKKGVKESDVWGLEPISLKNVYYLKQRIKFRGRAMCPPTEAALAYEVFRIRKKEIGTEEAYKELKQFSDEISKYDRKLFEVPVSLMSENIEEDIIR